MYECSIASEVTSLIEQYLQNCDGNSAPQTEHLSGCGPAFLFEQKLKKYYQKQYAIAFSSATTAIGALCIALELRNKEIITTPVNWGGSIGPFLTFGNRLRFASVDPFCLNLDPHDLHQAITDRSKVVLSVDYNGTPADSESIKEFCDNHGLLYISDSAQSLGAFRDNMPAGWFADVVVLSFSPGKSVFGGEGGAILTDNKDIYERLIWVSQHPSRQKTVFGLSYYNEYAPVNGRMNPLTCILLNETIESSLEKLTNFQTLCFSTLQVLIQADLVEPMTGITSADNSTFYNFSMKLRPDIDIPQVKNHLIKLMLPFDAFSDGVKWIPADPLFAEQFNRRYMCSQSLLTQMKGSTIGQRAQLTMRNKTTYD